MLPLNQLVEQLTLLTESNVSAAVALDVAEVSALSHRRADLLFELKVRLQDQPKLEEEEQRLTREATERLARAEHRLNNVVGTVLRVFDIQPRGPSVYGRTGQLSPR